MEELGGMGKAGRHTGGERQRPPVEQFQRETRVRNKF